MILTSWYSFCCTGFLAVWIYSSCGWIPKKKNNAKVMGFHLYDYIMPKKVLETPLIVLTELSGHVETHRTKDCNHLAAVLSNLREGSSQYSPKWPGFLPYRHIEKNHAKNI